MEYSNDKAKMLKEDEDSELDELKKQFIVDGNEITKENLKKHIKTILEYCRITSEGTVILSKVKLTQKNKLGIAIMARYLGSKMDENINETVTPAELVEITNIARNNV